MGEVLRFAWYDIRRLLTSPRFYLSLLVVYACLWLCFGSVYLYPEETGESLQALELFIFASCNRIPQCMLTFGVLLLLGDAPFLHEGMSVYLIRSNRARWLLGQILFCLLTIVFYLLVVEIMLLSLSGREVSFVNNWSDTIMLASQITSGASLLYIDMIFTFPMNIVLSGAPYAIFALTLVYDSLLLLMFTLIGLAFNIRWKVGVGCLGAVALLGLRSLIDSYGNERLRGLLWFSPCNLATVSDRPVTVETIAYTVMFFLCVCGLLTIWGYGSMRSADLLKGEKV